MTTGTQPVWNKKNSSATSSPSVIVSSATQASKTDKVKGKDDEKNALLQFSNISQKFIDSYSSLEQHVHSLSKELAAQTAEKEQQFEEKNRLAVRLEKILSTLPSAVVVLDGHGRVQESNALAGDMLGLPIVGETWLNIISRSFAPRSDDGYEISLKDGRRVKVETRALGSEPGQIILLTDLTETRKLQENQSREQRLSVIGKMMASLAHQIRTPLSSALLYSGHISSHKLDAELQQRFHLNLQHSLKQLERQVSDMLLFASGGVASKQRFQLTELLKALAADLTSHMASKDAEITIDNQIPLLTNSDLTLFGNMQALLGAIANLIENSLHACRTNKQHQKPVDINVCIQIHNKNNIRISISDNGCGISDSDKKQVFQAFFTSRARGTGLGLAVVKTVIKSFKGEVTIESELDYGTTINLIIPCVQADSFAMKQSAVTTSSASLSEMQSLAGGQ